MGIRERAGRGEKWEPVGALSTLPPVRHEFSRDGIPVHLPVGLLITPFTIIIASITLQDTGKKTADSGSPRRKNILSVKWVGGSAEKEG